MPAPLSLESQLKLRSFYEYLDFCQQTLEDIRGDLASMDDARAVERLERFCVEADSWGFNSLYEIGLSLQMLLMNSEGRIHTPGFREALRRGLLMLSGLLEQCDRDFRWRLATADTLDALSEATDCTDSTDSNQ